MVRAPVPTYSGGGPGVDGDSRSSEEEGDIHPCRTLIVVGSTFPYYTRLTSRPEAPLTPCGIQSVRGGERAVPSRILDPFRAEGRGVEGDSTGFHPRRVLGWEGVSTKKRVDEVLPQMG